MGWNQTATPPERLDRGIITIALAAVFYNALLAILNAHVMRIGVSLVAVSEIIVLLSAILIILSRGLYEEDLTPFFYLLITLIISVYVSVINKSLIIDYFRNILIVFCFVTLGRWINLSTIKFIFIAASALVFGGLIFEIFFEAMYGDLFNPALYFEATRGIEQLEISGSKLFRNALGFEGRFTFGVIGHRSSSLFLEQVSLANFSGVMMIFLMTLWHRFSAAQRLFCILTIVLILVTNDSRTMLIFAAISILGFFAFPYLPRLFTIIVMPTFLIAGVFVYILLPQASGDNIPGRIVLTIKHFGELDLAAALGFSAQFSSSFADSGYIYVIIIGTIFSFVLLWLFVALYPACKSPEERRFAHSFSIFIFMNMMIGGTAVFSIKIACLLWLLAGYMKFADRNRHPSIA
ncbi:hypothetical protein [Roseibium algae]|uniref:Polymerase n=1 Tax=Roseibium algae TaxID=3123038 RepID=A0ABU8TQ43_9HYPH